jgi:hypothetical protein
VSVLRLLARENSLSSGKKKSSYSKKFFILESEVSSGRGPEEKLG